MANQLSIKSICDQRRQQILYNNPLSRINVISPYETTNYTKFDLDMRRKAEVLKYQKGSTKGNTLTKKQKWSQMVLGNSQSLSKSYINSVTRYENLTTKIIDCPLTKISIPLSASNVPPDPYVSHLYNDETVPLYNYINPISTRAYGFVNVSSLNPNTIFKTNIVPNVICESNFPNKIASIMFLESADDNMYTIHIQNIPLAIYIQGDLSGVEINESILNEIALNSIQLTAYYNDNIVPDRSIYRYEYSSNNILQKYDLMVSANTIEDGYRFKGIQYIGTVSISNILLYTSPRFIYDFKLTVNMSYISSKYPNIPSIHASILANVTPDQISLHSCSIQPISSSTNIPTMYITNE